MPQGVEQHVYPWIFDDALEVVTQYAQRQFRFCFFQPPQQKAEIAHYLFDGAKGMLGMFNDTHLSFIHIGHSLLLVHSSAHLPKSCARINHQVPHRPPASLQRELPAR
jgi:hypothetical protein